MADLLRILPFLALALAGLVPCAAQDDGITRAERARVNQTRETMRGLAQDLRAQVQAAGKYPAELKELVPTVRETVPKDAWGNEFVYEVIGEGDEGDYRLTSLGSDGKKGGAVGAADIVFTRAGEVRTLSPEDEAKLEARRDEARFQANLAVARLEMAAVGHAVVNHRRENKAWPQALKVLRKPEEGEPGKALDRCFVDPWGSDYQWRMLPHDNFAVVCLGADGKEGGKGRDADFVITEKEVREMPDREEFPSWRWRMGGGEGDWNAYAVADSVRVFQRQRGRLPASLDELTQAGEKPGEAPVRGQVPLDRWGNEFAYVVYGPEEFFVVALGKDGIQGGKGENADIVTPAPGVVERDFAEEAMPVEDANTVKARFALAKAKQIATKLNEYKEETENWAETLDAIKDKFPDKEVPVDPWGNAFVLVLTKGDKGEVTGFTVKSLGSDGAEGGEDAAADIKVNEKGEQVDAPGPAGETGREDIEDDEAAPEAAPAEPAAPAK